MSERLTGNWIDSYVKYTDHTEPCSLYREWVGVSVVAACLQRKCFLEWGQPVYPNLYTVLVGPSGARKGTAMSYGRYFLEKLRVRVSAESITREALIKSIKEGTENLTDPENPGLVGVTHSSITIFSPELTVFIGWDNKELMMNLCDWYDCAERWEYRTKNVGVDTIHGMWVNMLGATTPDLIQKTMPLDAIGGGLTARMVFVYADRKGKLVPDPFLSKADEELRDNLIADLESIKMLRGSYKVTDAFLENWVKWYPEQDRNPSITDNRFEGYLQRRPWTMLKMSMIMSAARSNTRVIDMVDFNRGLDLIKRTEVYMPRTFSGVGKRDDASTMSKVMAFIGNEKEVTFNDIMKVFYRDVDAEGLTRIILTLQKIGYIDVISQGKKEVIKYKETK